MTKTVGVIHMAGKEVFRQAVSNLSSVIVDVLDKTNLGQDDIDFLIPHQANKRIIDGVGKKLNLEAEKVIVTIADHGNTCSCCYNDSLRHSS